ncbi:major facilitator superfamily permease [Corynebacterium jeikeium]|jgi:MFS transporter, DHA1 family, inner membrane transport protein|uniref:Putative permease of the major facilitator superfamily n=1 Tax=Corynebacterium jeikeium (strain K411) TaxID=306537 RepID=Q4JTI8_CORJK|nr:putative permease of the major facilitator superfamily [Corynebacterium jeikeium K411]SQI19686.1 major facilitator superfamily permease [Corynebacterium jeikeium]SUY84792.1 major facilitator superfamily permease [Corynebacterium jeikeium]
MPVSETKLTKLPSRRPVPRQTEISTRHRYIAMVAMALGGFGIGTTEFVAMGLLNLIAEDFSISEDQAGHVISAYALGVVIGAPLITTLTGSIPRRRLALLLMGAFVIGNGLSVFAHSYGILMLSRFIAGFPHGAYFSVTALIAASMAPNGKRGKAVALTGMGLSIATVIGVPIAQWLGSTFGWNAAFAMVAAIGVITFVALWFTVPHMTLMPRTKPLTELGALVNSQVLMTLAIGTVGFGGMFAVYTYISWTLTENAGFNGSLIWIPLMVYGIGMVIGTYIGGVLADRNLEYAILGTLLSLVVVLSAFYFLSHNAVAGIINFGVIGLLGSTLVPNLQTRLMDVAGEAQTLAAALNHSALNMANAAGAAVGGAVIAAGYGYSTPALAGAAMAACGALLWIPAYYLRRRQLAAARA